MRTRGAMLAAHLEDRVTHGVAAGLRHRGWTPAATVYVSYGAPGWLRVLGRAVLVRPGGDDSDDADDACSATDPAAEQASPTQIPTPGGLSTRRGWRSFFTAPLDGATVRIDVGGCRAEVVADRQGHVDERIDVDLPLGWQEMEWTVAGGPPCTGRALIVDPNATAGLVSDIDDTVLVTSLPRPLLAARNTFFTQEHARRPVPGMSGFYRHWLGRHPDGPVIYLSTGAWNTFDSLSRFLQAHRFPEGPLLLTDWGPSNSGWFRSGPAHKRTQLERLAHDFPRIRWLLVGDDGQHDPRLYSEFARRWPDRVAAIAIRQLSAGQQVLAHGTPMPEASVREEAEPPLSCPVVRGSDGTELIAELAQV